MITREPFAILPSTALLAFRTCIPSMNSLWSPGWSTCIADAISSESTPINW